MQLKRPIRDATEVLKEAHERMMEAYVKEIDLGS